MRRALREMARLLRGVLAVAVACLVLAGALGLAVAWRLSDGPLDLAWAARRIEAAANARGGTSRLAIGGFAVRWRGFEGGARRGLELGLRDVRLVDGGGAALASVGTLDASVSMAGLLRGEVVPRGFAASGLELRLVREADGRVTLDLGGIELLDRGGLAGDGQAGEADAAGLADSLAELARPPRLDESAAAPGVRHLQQLRSVRLSDAVVTLQDRALGGSWRLDLDRLELERQGAGGVRGAAAARLALGSAVAGIDARAELTPDGGTELLATLAPLAAARLQEAANAQPGVDLGPEDLLDAAVQGSARLRLDAALRPVAGTLHAEAGTGRMRVAGAVIGFDRLSVDAEAGWVVPGWTLPQRLSVGRAQAVVHAPNGAWPTTLGGTAAIERAGGRVSGTASATLDHVAFADVGSLWPARLGGQVRPWIVENITGGTARDAAVTVRFDAGEDLRQVRLAAIEGSLVGEDATIWWLRPVPPVERAQAVLTIKDPQTLDIAIASGRQGGLALRDGTIHITGLDVKDQFMTLGADVSGPITEVLGILRHPRVRLLDRKPMTMRNPGGAMAGRLGVFLPLNHDLTFDDVKISARARATELRLGGLIAGRDLERGDVRLELTPEQLSVAGQATVGGVAAEISTTLDFRDGPGSQVVQRARAAGRATPRQMVAAGLDTGGIMEGGAGQFTAAYAQRRDGTAELLVGADLREAALGLVGWKKAVGAPAEASARLVLRGDKLQGIEALRAQGPGMAVEGRAQMVGDRPLLLVLDRVVLGATQGAGQVRLPGGPGEPIRATLSGAVLDLSSQLSGSGKGSEGSGAWVADVRFDRVLLAGQRGVAGVVAHAEHDGRRLSWLDVTSGAPEQVQATIRPEGAGRRVVARAADGGALLRAMDVVDTVQGGALAVDGVYDDGVSPAALSGTAELAGFRVRDAPALGKLLQAVTIFGVVEALSGPGLSFRQATIPFRYDGSVLDFNDARAFSASLGLTARGRIDQRRGVMDLQGTVVPAYVLNSFLGRIPLLGRLFSAEAGGGLVAVNYTLRGPVGNPSVTVNPLSALTPGFLRGLFHIFD